MDFIREEKVVLQNFVSNPSAKKECEKIDPPNNVAYVYVDNLVLTPFHIIPKELVVCNKDSLYFQDLSFYELPLSWTDDHAGLPRRFSESGTYTLLAQAGTCRLSDTIHVVVLNDDLTIDMLLHKCEGKPLSLAPPFAGQVTWSDMDTSFSKQIRQSGTYVATVAVGCGDATIRFEVEEKDCTKLIQTANVFTPNGDGDNDSITFYFDESLQIEGTLNIYDRWGNLVYKTPKSNPTTWDGRFSGKNAAPGVYLWMFEDVVRGILQTGNITLLR